MTEYPINYDYESTKKMSEEYGVSYFCFGGGKEIKTSYHLPLDLSGSQDPTDSFIHCFHANHRCNMLSEGKFYTCTVAPNIPIFCKKFDVDIPLSKEDGIDIFELRNGQELFERLSRPMPVCRFCNVKERTYNHPWKQSEGDIREWTI